MWWNNNEKNNPFPGINPAVFLSVGTGYNGYENNFREGTVG